MNQLLPRPPAEMPPRDIPWPSGVPRSPPILGGGSVAFGGGGGATGGFNPPGEQSVYIRERYHLANLIDISILLNTGISVKALDRPDGVRNFLMIRNSSPATEFVYVGFGNPATALSSLALVGPASATVLGGIVLFDVSVPQDDIWFLGSAVTARVSYAYSNIPPWN